MARSPEGLRPTRLDADAATRYRASREWRDELLGDCFDRTESAVPYSVAVVDRDRRLTFLELGAAIRQVAGWLARHGIHRGDVVAFQLPSWWEAVVVAHAAFRLGAVVCPLLPNLREHELTHIFGESEPTVLFVPRVFRGHDYHEMLDQLDESPPLIVTVRGESGATASWDETLSAPEAEPDPPPSPDDVALLLYTSGTTAAPKGVLHTHNTLVAEATGLGDAHRVTGDDVVFLPGPLAHVGGIVYGVLFPAILGTRAVLLDIWDARTALDLVEREAVTVQTGVPFFLHDMLADEEFKPRRTRSLRLFTMGGTNVTPFDVDTAASRLNCWCKRSYGSSEMPTLTTGPFEDLRGRLATTDGLPIGSSEVRLEGDGPPGTGESGEILCRGPELFVGYLDAALNANSFTKDGWFRTGDLGVVDDDGFLSIVGRKKDVIIRGGENISPKEVEDLLVAHDSVTDVAIVAMPDPVLGERAVAFVETADPAFTFETMLEHLRDTKIARFKLPERLELRSELPRTSTGKIRKDLLRAEIAQLIDRENS